MLVLSPQQQADVSAIAERWDVAAFDLFGSAVNESLRLDSDIDVLVEFKSDARRSLFDLMRMEEDLESVFERPVDLMTRRGVVQSQNPLRRETILASARPLYRADS